MVFAINHLQFFLRGDGPGFGNYLDATIVVEAG